MAQSPTKKQDANNTAERSPAVPITYYHVALTIEKELSLTQMKYIGMLLRNEGFEFDEVQLAEEKRTLIVLRLGDAEKLLRELEALRIKKKPTSDEPLQKQRSRISTMVGIFQKAVQSHLDPRILERESWRYFTFDTREQFYPGVKDVKDTATKGENLWEYVALFEDEEIVKAVISYLKKIRIDDVEKFKVIFGLDFIENIKRVVDSNKKDDPVFFIEYLTRRGVMGHIFPLHNPTKREQIKTYKDLKPYFGENNSFYFYFMEYYQKWLSFAAVAGLAVWIYDRMMGENPLTSPAESFFSLFMIFWATLFIKFWHRNESCLAANWDAHGTHFSLVDKNPDFKGTERINLITELPEESFSFSARLWLYLFSALTSLPFIAIELVIMFAYLNIKGNVKEGSLVYMPMFARLGHKGGIFAPGTLLAILPSIFQSVTLVVLGNLHKSAAVYTSHMENHQTMSDINNSIILKRVLFDLLTVYVGLGYIAFVQYDVPGLRDYLWLLFCTDEIRRVATETVIPLFMQRFKVVSKVSKIELVKKVNDPSHPTSASDAWEAKTTKVDQTGNTTASGKMAKEDSTQESHIRAALLQLECATYDPFDDYFELISQFGYIMMFAAAFPLAPVISYLLNMVELRSDFYKLRNITQRPIPVKTNGLGTWNAVLNILTIISIYSNILLFAFGTDQVAKIFPYLFTPKLVGPPTPPPHGGDPRNQNLINFRPAKGMGEYFIASLFCIEHLVILCVYLIKKLIANQPEWVHVLMERQKHREKRGN